MNPEGARLGQAYGLGEPLGVWRRELKRPRGVWWLFGLLLVVVAGVVVAVLSGTAGGAVAVLLVTLFLVGLFMLVMFLNPRPRVGHWLYGYTGGLVEVYPTWSPRVVRWDEVTDVADRWEQASDESPAVYVYEGWLLSTTDGLSIMIAADYRNADLIYERAVAPVVARRVAAIRAGAVVECGGARVNNDGITGCKDKAVTPWAAIERVELRPGHVRVRLVGGRSRRYNDHWNRSGSAVFCQMLLALGVNATCKPIR